MHVMQYSITIIIIIIIIIINVFVYRHTFATSEASAEPGELSQ